MDNSTSTSDQLSNDLSTASDELKTLTTSIDGIRERLESSETPLAELNSMMSLTKQLQTQVSDQKQSFTVSLSKLRKDISTKLVKSRQLKGSSPIKVKEGKFIMLGNVKYVAKDGELVKVTEKG
jgi:predicted  nucleic acid-binding Zn-ribbon protein